MTEKQIFNLAKTFRIAIERARNEGEFQNDISFHHFPKGCCGDTSDLLAEYLHRNGVETIWVSMERDGSHAWLVVKDLRVKEPTPTSFNWPEHLWDTLKGYGVENPEKTIDTTRYEETDLENGLLIDITSDQFPEYSIPVYVGIQDDFHRQFRFIQAHDYEGLGTPRLDNIYRKIMKYL